MFEESANIEARHIADAVKRARPIEEQVRAKYGSYYAGLARDVSSAQKSAESPYNYWNWHEHDEKRGYE